MLEIAKKIYNGITSEKVFRIYMMIALTIVGTAVIVRIDDMQSDLSMLKYHADFCGAKSSEMANALLNIQIDAQSIEDKSRTIATNTRRIVENTY